MADDKKNPFLHALNSVIGDTPQEEGVTPSMSPIDFIAPSMFGAAVEAAPRILGNEIGSVGPGVARLIAKQAAGESLSMAEQIQLAAAKSAVQGPAGGITNNVAMQQAGTPFQEAAAARAAQAQAAARTPPRYAEGGEVAPAPEAVQAPLLTGEQRLAQEQQAAIAPPPAPAAQVSSQVNMFNPQGDLVSVPAHQAKAAESEGYKPATDQDVHKHMSEEKYGGLGQQAIAGLEGVGQGIAGPLATAAELALGVNKEDILGREEANPTTNMIGQGVGLVGGSFIGSTEARGLMTLPKLAEMAGAKAVGTLLPEFASKEAALMAAKATGDELAIKAARGALEQLPMSARLGGAATKAAVENMVIQGSNETSKMILQDPKQSVETALVDVGLAGLIGGGIGGAIGAVPPLWKAANESKLGQALRAIKNDAEGALDVETVRVNPILRKGLATFGGVSEKDIEAYAANRAAINAIPEADEIYQHALSHVEDIHAQVADAGLKANDAKAAFSSLEQDMKARYRADGYDARVSERMAKQALGAAQEKVAIGIQEQALNASQPIVGAVEALHNSVVEQSKAAYELLNQETKQVNLGDFFAKGNKLIEDKLAEGTLEAQAQASKIQSYLDNVIMQHSADAIPAPIAKKLIQGLDAVSKYDYNASAFDKGLSSSYKQLRYELDSTLKSQVPEYANLMKPLAKDVELLKGLKNYGEESAALRRLKGIKAPDRYRSDMDLLRQLEARTGTKFTDVIEPYADPAKTKALLKSIPEYAEHQKAASISQELKDPRTIKALDEALSKSPEYQKMVEAQTRLAEAEEAKAAIKGVTPTTLESKMAAAARGKAEPNRILEQFPKLEGKSLPELLELQKVKQSFEKGAMNGSRNVNLYAGVVGSIMGALGGHPMGGAGIGATLGGAADRYGPTVTKKILDAYLDKFGNVSKLTGAQSTEAAHLAMAKFLASGQPPSAEGFKAAADYIQSIERGEAAITRASKAVFKAGREVLPQAMMPKAKDREKLDKQLQSLQVKPDGLYKTGGAATQYMDDHGEHMGTTAANAVGYLNSIRPNNAPTTPLGKPLPVDPIKKAQYDRALSIAQQPLTVLDRLKKGTIVPADVIALKTMYPALYTKFATQLTDYMTQEMAKGHSIPYNTRLGLSLFLGQPLDGTMTASAIMAAQMAQSGNQAPQQGQQPQETMRPTQSGMKGLSKLAPTYLTPNQARQAARAKPSH
jgi:hypothetical protein